MKVWLSAVVAICLFASGCSREESRMANIAWQHQLTRLKAPATAKLVSQQVHLSQDRKLGWVDLTYDAQNSYGALLRGATTVHLDWREGDQTWVPGITIDKPNP